MHERLSQRAQDYLSSLERVPHVAPEQLKKLMLQQDIEPAESWLEFQEYYAGYVQNMGADGAVWGIAHESKRYFEYPEPLKIEHDYYEHEQARVVNCADVHASYDFMLTEHGRFLGRPAESFEIYIEQLALWQAFLDRHPNADARYLFNDTSYNAQLEDATVKVDSASDKHHTYVQGDKILGVKEEPDGRWIRVLLADPPPKPGHANTQKSSLFNSLLSDIKMRFQR